MRTQVHDRQRGFSLIELMIALVLGLLVTLAASNVFLSNKQSYRTNAAIGTIQENSRIAFGLLSRDLRQARLTGCGNLGAVSNDVNNNTDPGNWFADFANRGLIGFSNTGAGTADADSNPALTTGTNPSNHVTGTDNLTLIGAGSLSYSLSASYDATSGLLINEANPDLGPGDLVVICDPSQADIAQITGLNGAGFRLQTGVGTPGNSGGLVYPYTASSTLVSPLESVTWYIGCNPLTALACDPAQGGTSLYRLSATGVAASVSVTTQAQEMVRGVSAIGFTYHQSGASLFQAANDVASWAPTVVDAVRISLTLVGHDTRNTSGPPITRSLSTVVTLRNPPLN
jgi:type IV pilus assembly protein PilW